MTFTERAERFARVYNDTATYPTLADVASELGVAYKTVKNFAGQLRRMRKNGEETPDLIDRTGKAALPYTPEEREIEVPVAPSADEPIEDLIARAIAHHERVAAYYDWKKVIDVKVKMDGPVGIVGLPDQHLNNIGSQIKRAFQDAELIAKTPGVYAVAIGDSLDNFIMGRLERERRKDIMSHTDAMRIQDHYFELLHDKLLVVIGGNHNDWVGQLGGYDALAGTLERLGIKGIYDNVEQRVRLTLPSGAQFVHLARHNFPGQSQFHPTHGILKWALQNWQGEDVIWGGHIHQSGYMRMTQQHMGEQRVVHCVQLSSYKKIDNYARTSGFRVNDTFTTPMVVHDPRTMKTTWYDDIEHGLDVLAFMRSKW